MKEPLLQGNWKIEIQVSFKFDKICIVFIRVYVAFFCTKMATKKSRATYT